MITTVKLVREIEKLSLIERIQIVDIVIRDIIHPDSNIDKIWAKEASARWNAYKRGDIKSIPYEKVMSKYKKL